MSFVLVSSNPLFAEILRYTLLKVGAEQVVQVAPDVAPEQIALERPEVVVVDESRIDGAQLDEVLTVARRLPHSRTILLNLQSNDITIVSAEHATIGKVEDMMKAIRTVEEQTSMAGNGEVVKEDIVEAARARASAYGFLALLCNQCPDLNLVRRLRVLDLGGFLGPADAGGGQEVMRRGLQEMVDFVAHMEGEADGDVREKLAVDWTRLFRGIQPGYGPPPPYEGVYAGGDALRTMQDVARVYRTYGVAPAAGGGSNRPDYLGLELDFLRYACEQQAEACLQEDEEALEKWMEAEKAFLSEHADQWVPAYCERAMEEAQTEFYRGMLQLIKGVVNENTALIR